MKFLKKYWKETLIVLLTIMFMSKCSSSGNYERKYNKQVTYTENVIDSLTKENNALRDTLKDIRHINESLGNEITIYKEQNSNLSDAAKRQVIVRVNKK